MNRLSSCCEYKHRKGSRLGGKRGYFGFVCVERSSPCYKYGNKCPLGEGRFCYMLLCMLLLMYFSAQFVKNHINVDEPKISRVKVVYHNPVCCI